MGQRMDFDLQQGARDHHRLRAEYVRAAVGASVAPAIKIGNRVIERTSAAAGWGANLSAIVSSGESPASSAVERQAASAA